MKWKQGKCLRKSCFITSLRSYITVLVSHTLSGNKCLPFLKVWIWKVKKQTNTIQRYQLTKEDDWTVKYYFRSKWIRTINCIWLVNYLWQLWVYKFWYFSFSTSIKNEWLYYQSILFSPSKSANLTLIQNKMYTCERIYCAHKLIEKTVRW